MTDMVQLRKLCRRAEVVFRERFPTTEYHGAAWDDWVWDLKPCSRKTRARYVNFGSRSGGPSMPDALRDMVRAFFMDQHFSTVHMAKTALIVAELWDLLVDRGFDRDTFQLGQLRTDLIAELEPRILERQLDEDSIYTYMTALESLIRWAIGRGLVAPNLEVVYKSRREGTFYPRTKEAKQKRLDRLPDLDVIAALGQLYRSLAAPQDRLRICAVTLQLLAGLREDEATRLSLDGLRYEEGEDGRRRWYILYNNLKSPPGSLEEVGKRWLSPLAAALAVKVWEEVRALTAPWRPFAQMVDRYDDRIPLDHAFPGREFITQTEVQRLLGVTSRKGWSHLRRRDGFDLDSYPAHDVVPDMSPRRGATLPAYRRDDVERWLVSQRGPTQTIAPDGKPQRVADTLFIMPRWFLLFRPGALVFPEPLHPASVYRFLTGRTSVFVRHGLTDATGKPFRLRPHSLRHFLTTLANKAGMTALQIHVWMGRASEFHTYAYLHDPEDYAEYARHALGAGLLRGPRPNRIRNLPARQRQAAIEEQEVAHMAGDNICVANFLVRECPQSFNCHAGCPWTEYDITDPVQVQRLRLRHTELQANEAALRQRPDESNPVYNRQLADVRAQLSQLDQVLSEAPNRTVRT